MEISQSVDLNLVPKVSLRDHGMQELLGLTETVAKSKATVLILGPSGSGKMYLARYLIRKSQRIHKSTVEINSAELRGTAGEAQLIKSIEQAHGGTLVVREVSRLEPLLQLRLIQMIQDQRIQRPGSAQSIPVDVRIVLTSSVSLLPLVKSQTFREDLFYRINGVQLKVPPLAERLGDIEFLANEFLNQKSLEQGKEIKLHSDAIRLLNGHRWPGNVRELEGVLERAMLFAQNQEILAKDIALASANEAQNSMVVNQVGEWRPGRTLNEIEQTVIIEALKYHSGNRTHTARALGISIRTLRNKLAEYRVLGIPV